MNVLFSFSADLFSMPTPLPLIFFFTHFLEFFFFWYLGLFFTIYAGGQVSTTRSNSRISFIFAELLDQYSHVLSDVVSIYFCLSKMKHFVVVNSIYKTYFKVNPPARVCITPLLFNDVEKSNSSILFQIDCLSYKEATVNKKKAMHVQSISHWAPANIGKLFFD